ncbi:protein moonraker-like isoform X2 [Asterias rubens]|uniref:protein moonraker-like isoform X2 n=1 Tax=Asterias rubens TaxID=7604 RepID=UPI00145577E9|nr:protein moonraker-like isoform X2 [Asterias rubens]
MLHHQNQLQFNLDMPSMAGNLAARYHNPGPLVIEKLGGGGAKKSGTEERIEPSVKFSSISEDRLSMAIRLAQHDLKHMLSKKQAPIINESPQQTNQGRKTKTKRSPSGKSRRQLKNTNVRVQERYRNPNEYRRTVETQTPTKKTKKKHGRDGSSHSANTYGLVLKAKMDQHDDDRRGRQIREESSPGKDVAPSLNSQQATEIRRLRLELRTYIKKVEELSIKASQQKAVNKKDEEDTEDDPRRAARVAEQASRSARLLYSLQQQVREIQEELDKLGPGKVRHTKKDFQDALAKQISTSPRPKSKQTREPSPVPRRRLAFEGDAGPHSKPRQRAQAVRVPKESDPSHPYPYQGRVRETPVRDLHSDTPRATLHTTPSLKTVERLRQTIGIGRATPGSPERNAALRAGLEALLRAGQPSQGSRPSQPSSRVLPNTTQATSKPRRKLPAKGPPPATRSLILPAKLKADRERLQRVRATSRDAHFTQETVASKLKHREPVIISSAVGQDQGSDKPTDETRAKPVWTPPGSPRSFHKASPRPPATVVSSDDEGLIKDRERSARRRKVIFNLEEDDPDKTDAGRSRGFGSELMQRETARQAWLDREAAEQRKQLDIGRSSDGYPPVPHQWLQEAEKAIHERLQPIIDKAEAVTKEQQLQQYSTRQSLHHQLSQRAMQATSDNADLLSDLLLEDILADTALEFHRIDSNECLERQARQLQDAPTVEGILHSLDNMELVEDEIRRRWKRVEYIDQGELQGDSIQQKEARWMLGTPLDGDFLESFPDAVPTSHTSMQFTNSHIPTGSHHSAASVSSNEPQEVVRRPTQRETFLDYTSRSEDDSDMDAQHPPQGDDSKTNSEIKHLDPSNHSKILQSLLGTRPQPAAEPQYTGHHSVPTRHERGTRPAMLDRPRFPLFIPSDMMNRIKDSRGRFEHHLKSTSHWSYGTFDPWKLVEEVADEIVSEIIKDVSGEVSEVMGHCVDDLYKAEFNMT